MAQSVKHLMFDSNSGHDLRVEGWNPASDSVLGVQPAEDSLSLSPSKRKKSRRVDNYVGKKNTQYQFMDY